MDVSATSGLPDKRPGGVVGLTRPSRVLIGWMTPTQAETILGGNTLGKVASAEHRDIARIAREVVASVPAGIDQSGIVSPLPQELEEHVAQLRQTPAGAAMFQQGWEVVLVDLARVCAFPPTVVAD